MAEDTASRLPEPMGAPKPSVSPSDPPLIPVSRAFLVRVDSICSLVAYRYGTRLPRDIQDELKEVSVEARRQSGVG